MKILYLIASFMESKSQLNPASAHWYRLETEWVIFLVVAAVSMSLLYGRLAAIYRTANASPQQVTAMRHEATALPIPELRLKEDAALFTQAQRLGLLRIDQVGRIEVAPADLPLRQRWSNEHPDLLVAARAGAPNWLDHGWNEEHSRWHRVLHFSATGRYVRQQIAAFNQQRMEFPYIQWREGKLVWQSRL